MIIYKRGTRVACVGLGPWDSNPEAGFGPTPPLPQLIYLIGQIGIVRGTPGPGRGWYSVEFPPPWGVLQMQLDEVSEIKG